MTEVSGTFFFFHSLGLASPLQKSSPLTMSSDRQFEKWLEGPPFTDQVRSRLDDYTTKIQDIAQVALDPDSAPFAEAKVKQVRANLTSSSSISREQRSWQNGCWRKLMRLQTSLHPERQLRLTWSMSLPSTSTIEQKKYRMSWLPCTPELQTQHSESWISLFRHSARRRLK